MQCSMKQYETVWMTQMNIKFIKKKKNELIKSNELESENMMSQSLFLLFCFAFSSWKSLNDFKWHSAWKMENYLLWLWTIWHMFSKRNLLYVCDRSSGRLIAQTSLYMSYYVYQRFHTHLLNENRAKKWISFAPALISFLFKCIFDPSCITYLLGNCYGW